MNSLVNMMLQPAYPAPPLPLAKRSRPMRVALFSGNYDCVRDGANQALNRLVGHLLDQEGAEVRIYSPRAARPAFAARGNISAVPSISLPGRPEYRLALGFTRSIRANFATFAPDIVHLSAPDLLGRQAQHHARSMGIPVVASLHTRFETYAHYYRMGFLRPAIERYLDRFYGACDHILAPTIPIAKELGTLYGEERVSVWGRGVDRNLFDPSLRCEQFRTCHGFDPDEAVPLFFGRLVIEKGLATFADAILALRAKGFNLRPLIVGEGPARGWLERRLPDAVFTGHLEGAELGRAVASADILLNPSVTEAFGNVNLEAMASGLAIVSADVDSASALITHGHDGVLVPATEPTAFADAVERLIRDRGLRAAMGQMANRTASRYRWDEVLSAVCEVYGQYMPS